MISLAIHCHPVEENEKERWKGAFDYHQHINLATKKEHHPVIGLVFCVEYHNHSVYMKKEGR